MGSGAGRRSAAIDRVGPTTYLKWLSNRRERWGADLCRRLAAKADGHGGGGGPGGGLGDARPVAVARYRRRRMPARRRQPFACGHGAAAPAVRGNDPPCPARSGAVARIRPPGIGSPWCAAALLRRHGMRCRDGAGTGGRVGRSGRAGEVDAGLARRTVARGAGGAPGSAATAAGMKRLRCPRPFRA